MTPKPDLSISVPFRLLDSKQFRRLGLSELQLLLELCRQHASGVPNGQLSLTLRRMREGWNWGNASGWYAACLKSLERKQFIQRMNPGSVSEVEMYSLPWLDTERNFHETPKAATAVTPV